MLGSHVLVEWDEPDSPQTIVDAKNVTAVEAGGDRRPRPGDKCRVTLIEGHKRAVYEAKVTASGRNLN